MAVAGCSAGGHLSALTGLALDDAYFDAELAGGADPSVDAVVSLYGRYDWTDRTTRDRDEFVRLLEKIVVRKSMTITAACSTKPCPSTVFMPGRHHFWSFTVTPTVSFPSKKPEHLSPSYRRLPRRRSQWACEPKITGAGQPPAGATVATTVYSTEVERDIANLAKIAMFVFLLLRSPRRLPRNGARIG